MTQISSAIMMGLIFGAIFWQCYDRAKEYIVLDTQMTVTMSVLMAAWLPYDVTLTFPKERQVFLRERKAALYPTSAFYLARISADMPMHVVSAWILATIVYFMAGLQGNYFIWCGVHIYGILVGAAIMQWIGTVCQTFEEANILMMVVMMMTMMMSSGFVRDVPKFLEW